MRSPFDDLGKNREPEPEGEEVEGAFSCQQIGCFYVMNTARYLTANQLITWVCPSGHYSKANMNLD